MLTQLPTTPKNIDHKQTNKQTHTYININTKTNGGPELPALAPCSGETGHMAPRRGTSHPCSHLRAPRRQRRRHATRDATSLLSPTYKSWRGQLECGELYQALLPRAERGFVQAPHLEHAAAGEAQDKLALVGVELERAARKREFP